MKGRLRSPDGQNPPIDPMFLLLRITVALGLALLVAPGHVIAQSRPNLLFVIADDLGHSGVGAYGSTSAPPTPTLDSLAGAGVRYQNCWAMPTCSPTRATLLTGRYPSRHGVGAALVIPAQPELDRSEVLLPEVLSAVGYTNALVGKYHLDGDIPADPNDPNLQGFDYYAGNLIGAVASYTDWDKTVQGVTTNTTKYATTDAVDEALGFINSQQGPWSCVLAFNAPHTPFHRPPEDLFTQPLTGNPVTNRVGHYNAMIEAMDTELGRLFDELGGLNAVLADTIVVFVGDNGRPPAAATRDEPASRIKGTLYQGGVRVPLLVAGPNVVRRGRVRNDLVSVADLYVSAAGWARAALPAGVALDGVDLTSSLSQPRSQPVREVVAAQQFLFESSTGEVAVRDSRYKLIGKGSRSWSYEFYDLLRDPDERQDLLRGVPLTSEQRTALYQLLLAANNVR